MPYAAPAAVVAAPSAPQQLPDPATVQKQKEGYTAALDKQFADGANQVAAETKLRKDQLMAMAQQQKAQYQLQKEAELQAQNLLLDQQMNSQVMMLQEATMAQKAALEQQAAALTLEYNQKKAMEEMQAKQYAIQKQYYEAEVKLAQQYNTVANPRNAGA
jgi:hypothetical protein